MEFRVVGIGIRIWKLELAETRPRLGRDHGRDIAMCEPRHQIKHKKRHFDTKKKTFWIRDPPVSPMRHLDLLGCNPPLHPPLVAW